MHNGEKENIFIAWNYFAADLGLVQYTEFIFLPTHPIWLVRIFELRISILKFERPTFIWIFLKISTKHDLDLVLGWKLLNLANLEIRFTRFATGSFR